MKIRPSKLLILLVASCLTWVGLLWLALVICTVVPVGWVISGVVLLVMTVWMLVMLREIREDLCLRIAGIFRPTRTH